MASSRDVMQANLGASSAVYVYNGPSQLQELERVNLTGALVVFNGAYDLADLQRINFTGAIVLVNGQEMRQHTPDPGTIFMEATQGTKTSAPLRRHRSHDPYEYLRRSSRHRRRLEMASATSDSAHPITHETNAHDGQNGGMRPNEDGNVRKLPSTLVQPPKPPIFHQSTASKLTAIRNGQRSPTNVQVVSQTTTVTANEGYQLNLRKPDLGSGISSSQEGTSRSQHGGPELQLPDQSPLHSMITFAEVEEDIVQAKVQYNQAQKVWRREFETDGRSSEHTSQRLKQVGKLLKDLYEKREAAVNNRDRTRAYRNLREEVRDSNREGASSKAVLREVPRRQLCEQNERVKSSRYQEGRKMDLPSTVNRYDTMQPTPCRRVRFALTDLETFIEP